jgi:hypothetical protein
MRVSGTVEAFNVFLAHDDVVHVTDVAYLTSLAAAQVPPPVGEAIAGVLVTAASYIQAIDFLGGRNGVNVSAVAGAGMIVTPAFVPADRLIELINAIFRGAWDIVRGIINVPISILPKIGIGTPRGELHADESEVGDCERFGGDAIHLLTD